MKLFLIKSYLFSDRRAKSSTHQVISKRGSPAYPSSLLVNATTLGFIQLGKKTQTARRILRMVPLSTAVSRKPGIGTSSSKLILPSKEPRIQHTITQS